MTQPQLPARQRLSRLLLGVTTMLLLLAGVMVMAAGEPEVPAELEASATATTTSTVPGTGDADTSVPATSAPTTTLPTTTLSPATLPSTSTTARETSTTEPATTTTTLEPLVLAATGLGAVDFGDDYATVANAVTERLEGATADSGWVAARGEYGTCPGTVVRVVRWHSLRLFFSDGPTEFGEGASHFFYYSQSTVEAGELVDVATAEGIELGSTVEDLRDAYGNRLTIESTIRFGVTFSVDTPGSGLLSGTLSASGPEGVVTSIGGGFGCGG